MAQIKIIDDPTLVRDSHSKALLSVDRRRLAAALQARNSAANVAALGREINTLKDELAEIKLMIKDIANGRSTSSR